MSRCHENNSPDEAFPRGRHHHVARYSQFDRRLRNISSTSIFAGGPAPSFLLFLLLAQTQFYLGCCFTSTATRRIAPIPPLKTQVAFQYISTATTGRITTCIGGSGNDNDDNEGLQEKINSFLDTPFFDPEDESIEEGTNGSFIGWFAGLVKNDYETAEALYAGLFFAVLLVATQELVRYYMYGVDYVPFTRGGGGQLW